MKKIISIFFILCIFSTNFLKAAEAVSISSISTKTALELVNNAFIAASSKKVNITVTVIDSNGNILAQVKENKAANITLSASFQKAYTSVSLGAKSSDILDLSKKMAPLSALAFADNFLLLGGGMPIFMNGELVGAIGISGAPSPQIDEDIATEALKKAGLIK